jgi:hypothetical protein
MCRYNHKDNLVKELFAGVETGLQQPGGMGRYQNFPKICRRMKRKSEETVPTKPRL